MMQTPLFPSCLWLKVTHSSFYYVFINFSVKQIIQFCNPCTLLIHAVSFHLHIREQAMNQKPFTLRKFRPVHWVHLWHLIFLANFKEERQLVSRQPKSNLNRGGFQSEKSFITSWPHKAGDGSILYYKGVVRLLSFCSYYLLLY